MVMPGTPGFDAAHLLLEGSIEQHGWWVAITILIGNVLATAFLLWTFQRLFIANCNRTIQPYGSLHHPVFSESVIVLAISLLLIEQVLTPHRYLILLIKKPLALVVLIQNSHINHERRNFFQC